MWSEAKDILFLKGTSITFTNYDEDDEDDGYDYGYEDEDDDVIHTIAHSKELDKSVVADEDNYKCEASDSESHLYPSLLWSTCEISVYV